MYNKRLKITEGDYKKLANGFNWLLTQDAFTREDQINRYFAIAKEKNYTKTRIVFDLYASLTGHYTQENNKELYLFVRSLDYLTDNNLESALCAILKDNKIIGAKLEGWL